MHRSYAQMGGSVKWCRGITLYIKLENPKATRIQRCFVGDCLLNAEATYTVAFITNQGVLAKYGKNGAIFANEFCGSPVARSRVRFTGR